MKFDVLTANWTTQGFRYEKLEGVDYAVVPMVMIVEGVLSANQGSLLYPGNELSKSIPAWNAKPIVVYHPESSPGNYVSACTPSVLESRRVGLVLNTSCDSVGGKTRLKAEAWIDVKKANEVDPRVMSCLQSSKLMEVSSGLFSDHEDSSGTYNGKAYTAVARNFRPDHLALLPDREGACSIADGAGLGVNHAVRPECVRRVEMVCSENVLKTLQDAGMFLANELSHNNISRGLYSALSDKLGDSWYDRNYIADIFTDYVVYRDGDKFYKRTYTVNGTTITLADSVEEVVSVTEYKSVSSSAITSNGKAKDMNKEQLVNQLITNTATQWADTDRQFLMGLSEDHLGKMLPKENATPTANNAGGSSSVTMAEYIANAPPELQPVLTMQANHYVTEKTRVVTEILSNQNCPFTKEFLNTKDLPELEGILKLSANSQQRQQQQAGAGVPTVNNNVPMFRSDFRGQAGSFGTPAGGDGSGQGIAANQGAGAVEPLGLPVWDFSKK